MIAAAGGNSLKPQTPAIPSKGGRVQLDHGAVIERQFHHGSLKSLIRGEMNHRLEIFHGTNRRRRRRCRYRRFMTSGVIATGVITAERGFGLVFNLN